MIRAKSSFIPGVIHRSLYVSGPVWNISGQRQQVAVVFLMPAVSYFGILIVLSGTMAATEVSRAA